MDKHLTDTFRPTLKDALVTLASLVFVTAIGLAFTRFGFSEANIITVYILGVLVISVLTVSPLYGVIGSLASVLLFNWFFTDPKFSFDTYETEYLVTFAIMLVSSLITGTLANRMKQNARLAECEAFRTKVLLETNQQMQKAEKPDEVLSITAKQITTLINKNVIVFPVGEDGCLGEEIDVKATEPDTEPGVRDKNEKEIVEWVFSNSEKVELHSNRFARTMSEYHPISLNGYDYGVIVIGLSGVSLEPFEKNIMMSILGECEMALENLRNAREKEKAALMVKNEQLRSNLLRSMSHDIRTPLTSISGNASNLLSHYDHLDDATLRQIFSDIYDDAEWLIELVENLLSISRIENGQMELNLSLEVMSDVIEEALKHIDRKADQHIITVENTDDICLADMDARLIMQVIINLINNAIKNTPVGSTIRITSEQRDKNVVVSVIDNGPGIPDNIKIHVFEMFYTGNNKVVDGHRGLGLGLALCKSIVESHSGTITLLDNEPSGCRFEISLPMKEVQVNE